MYVPVCPKHSGYDTGIFHFRCHVLKLLSASSAKWSNTHKQFVDWTKNDTILIVKMDLKMKWMDYVINWFMLM